MRRILTALIGVLFISISIYAQEIPTTFKNPILPGYHPDPSICRVGDDYYLVNSTFVWYPGIPIYHSKDLVNWKLIGHGINRHDQLDFDGLIDKFGVFAVTIRYHEGTFYLITTCVTCDGNFYITAKDPAGPWSDPIWLKDAPAIDPSLFWDDDGRCYYTGMMGVNENDPSDCGIWMQELDLKNQKLVGERKILHYGHANNAQWAEGPHLYKINENYMLMFSEGGTGPYHAITVHHSDSLWGPYVSDMINPVISHRHFGNKYPVQAIGHGDLVQTQNGEWWCVALGKRVINGQTTLGRETYLAKVDFEGKTPIFNGGAGKMLEEQKRPDLPWTPVEQWPARDEFDSPELGIKWNYIRIPKEKFYEVKEGQLNIDLRPEVVDSLVNSSLIIQRVVDHEFEASTILKFETEKENEQAGLALYRTNENHYLLMKEKESIVLIRSFKGEKREVSRVPYSAAEVYLKAEGNDLEINFFFGESENQLKQISETQDLIVIADGNGNQFNGPGIGMYATSKGKESSASASFAWFEYKGK